MKKTKTKGLLNMGCQIHKVKTKYNRKNHIDIENYIDEFRLFRKDSEQFDMYNDPDLNWSGLR